MGDTMAIEELAACYTRLKGYITEVRVPYLNKEDREGNKKEDSQGGDIDIIGVSPTKRLIAIETKGYGGVESYENWCKIDRLFEIFYIIDKITKVKEIWVGSWNSIFKKKNSKFDEIWIIIPGPFIPKQEIRKIKGNDLGSDFIKNCINKINSLYSNPKWEYEEKEYISLYEKELKKQFYHKCKKVRIIPTHTLIEELMVLTCEDMFKRRKRYPDTALETFRWIARSVGHGNLDLAKVQKRIEEKYKKSSR